MKLHMTQNDQDDMEDQRAVQIPIEGVLDLHTFHPRDVPSLLKEYLEACKEEGMYSVRIIHGKGKGIQKNRVQGLLEKLSEVESYKDAGPDAGGWGATIVQLTREIDIGSPAWGDLLVSGAKAMGMSLNRSETVQFSAHAKELMAWNQKINLTAITDPTELAVKQFLDTIPLSLLPPPRSRVLDIGSGGGFPGIPLKILRPDLHVTLIDASRKKASFLKHVIRSLGLKGIEAGHHRVEELAAIHQQEDDRFDVIVSKAVSKLGRFLDQAAPLRRKGGAMIVMKGRAAGTELEEARSRIDSEGLVISLKEYKLPFIDAKRSLVILEPISKNV